MKATLHWVSAAHAVEAEVRLYDRLFSHENPLSFEDFREALNPDSLKVLTACKLEPGLAAAKRDSAASLSASAIFVRTGIRVRTVSS